MKRKGVMAGALCGLLAWSAIMGNAYGKEAEPSPRETVNFNREWKFRLGDCAGAERPGFDDASWEWTHLPHSFSMPYFLAKDFYSGCGWYRKTFVLPENWEGRRIKLEFEGAFQVLELFVNGKPAGRHEGGYVGFEFDITDFLRPGENVVAARVNNIWNPRLAPRSGEHVFSGGIYRDVLLHAVDPVHVAWYGTFVTTPELSEESGRVRIAVETENQSGAEAEIELTTEIFDPVGKRVAETRGVFRIPAGETRESVQLTDPIPRPMLWSPDAPNLYSAVSTLRDKRSGRIRDRYVTEFGFRWVEWTADKGFFLNGKPLYLRGANVHQDRAGWGDAAANSAFERDVRMMKAAGWNIIRGSHYPHDPAFSEACDRIGMMFWSENCFWGTGSFSRRAPGTHWSNAPAYPENPEDAPEFEESVRRSLESMIRIHRNHPSIVVWSLCNEVFFSRPESMPRVREFLRELTAYAHELDPSRKVAVGGAQRGEVDRCADIAGYNGDGARLAEYQNPGVPNIVSEYGSAIAVRPGDYAPKHTDGICGRQVHPWRSGEILWCGIDHGSTGGSFGWMGAVDYFRIPKRQYLWYRTNYAGAPEPEWPGDRPAAELKLTADSSRIAPADGTSDVHLLVTVLDAEGKRTSQCPEVRLAVLSGPGEFPTGRSIAFSPGSDIAIREGQCAIELRAHYAGTTVVEATSPGLKSSRVEIVSSGAPEYSPEKAKTIVDRPYVRFTPDKAEAFGAGANMALDKPTRSSGDAPGHSGILAVDGKRETYWQADRAGKGVWFSFTPERIVELRKLTIDFPEAFGNACSVEASMDGFEWRTLSNAEAGTPEKTRVLAFPRGEKALHVRILFDRLPDGACAKISEIGLEVW